MSNFDLPVDDQELLFDELAQTPPKLMPVRDQSRIRCPAAIKLPREWKYAIDPNELIPQHRGYEELVPHSKVVVHAADYSVVRADGVVMDRWVAVERKAPKDIIGCVASGRDRFERSLEKLRGCMRPAIVIECNFKDFAKESFYKHTKVKPAAVVGSIIAWSTRLRIPVFPCSNRFEAIQMTQWILNRAALDWKDEHNEDHMSEHALDC